MKLFRFLIALLFLMVPAYIVYAVTANVTVTVQGQGQSVSCDSSNIKAISAVEASTGYMHCAVDVSFK